MITEFGKYLRKVRVNYDETLKDMARKIGVTSSYLSAIENGKRRIPEEWIETIAEMYGVPFETLQNAVDKSAKEVTIKFEDQTSADREIVFLFARNFNRLNKKEKESIKNILSGISF